MIVIKSEREIALMREAGRLVALAHAEIARAVQPGITTAELDRIAEEFILAHGGQPSFKGYQGYPATICASINEEVVHGIPGQRLLKEGDIVSVDIGVVKNGYHGDAAVTLAVGTVGPEARRLLKVTEEALYQGIAMAKPGKRLSDISHAIQVFVEAHGYSVVREYVGHGIGRDLHEEPQIPNFGPPGLGPILKPGMTLAIEPMVNVGGYEVTVRPDQWTVVTRDRSLSAHFEHTIVITKDGAEILTKI